MNSTGYDAVPEMLRSTPQWAVWKSIPQASRAKPLKVPYLISGKPADTRNRNGWSDFVSALQTWNEQPGQYDGLGFLFTPQDNFAGLDIDNCIVEGVILPFALELIKEFDTYTEFSPSGTGVKLFLRSSWKPDEHAKQGTKQGDLELYYSKRYFTVTGRQVPGTPDTITDCTVSLRELFHRLLLMSPGSLEKLPEVEPEPLPEEFLKAIALRSPSIASRVENEQSAIRAGAEIVDQLYQDRDQRVDRSRNDMHIAFWMLSHGYRAGQVLSVLTHPVWFSGSKSRDKSNDNYALTTVGRALAAVKQRRRTLPDARKHRTELGNAERLIEAFGNNLRYNEGKGGWLTWTGSCWLPDQTGIVSRYLNDVVRGMHDSVSSISNQDEAEKALKWAFRSEEHKVHTNSLKMATCLEGVTLPFEAFDNALWHFPALNGVIDLRTGVLEPHARERYFTTTSPIHYDPDARCPKWEAALETWLPDAALRTFVQRAVGYTLTGSISEQVFFFLHGPGSNGKSTFMLVLQGLLGKLSRRITTEAITQHKHGNPGSTRDQAAARLAGARMGIVSEAEQNMRLAEGWIKDMTGGGAVSTKVLYKDQSETVPTAKIWFDANYRLRAAPGSTDGADAEYDAFWRRMREIPFPVRVPSSMRVRDFHRVLLSEEGPGILAWAVEGCLDWQENGLPVPEVVRMATQEYRSEMDTLRPFFDQWLTKEEGAYISQKEMYTLYKLWANQDGETAVQKRVLREWLKERGFNLVMHNGVESWKGYKPRQKIAQTEYVTLGS